LTKDLAENPEKIKDKTWIHKILVRNQEKLANQIRNKYIEYMKYHMGENFEMYSEEELITLVEEAVKNYKKIWEREGRDLKEFEKEYEPEMRRSLLEVYKGFNIVFGKQKVAKPSQE
jgi:hypothetical protein